MLLDTGGATAMGVETTSAAVSQWFIIVIV
jgi:hypothetical protein